MTDVTRDGVVADLRKLAEQAEVGGDRKNAVRALKLAWRIEHHCPANPVPPSIDQIIELCGTIEPLICRFVPEEFAGFAADVSELRQRRLELIEAERETATVH